LIFFLVQVGCLPGSKLLDTKLLAVWIFGNLRVIRSNLMSLMQGYGVVTCGKWTHGTSQIRFLLQVSMSSWVGRLAKDLAPRAGLVDWADNWMILETHTSSILSDLCIICLHLG
jgi:hypothetical protein